MARRVPASRRRRNKLSDDWAADFLGAFREGMSRGAAAEIAGVTRAAIYHRMKTDYAFRLAVAEAREDSRQIVEQEIRRRSLDPKEGSDWLLWKYYESIAPAQEPNTEVAFDQHFEVFLSAVESAVRAAQLNHTQDAAFKAALAHGLRALEDVNWDATPEDVEAEATDRALVEQTVEADHL